MIPDIKPLSLDYQQLTSASSCFILDYEQIRRYCLLYHESASWRDVLEAWVWVYCFCSLQSCPTVVTIKWTWWFVLASVGARYLLPWCFSTAGPSGDLSVKLSGRHCGIFLFGFSVVCLYLKQKEKPVCCRIVLCVWVCVWVCGCVFRRADIHVPWSGSKYNYCRVISAGDRGCLNSPFIVGL